MRKIPACWRKLTTMYQLLETNIVFAVDMENACNAMMNTEEGEFYVQPEKKHLQVDAAVNGLGHFFVARSCPKS